MTMTVQVAGSYKCTDCNAFFEIPNPGDTTTAYGGWTPVCPVCGTDQVKEYRP